MMMSESKFENPFAGSPAENRPAAATNNFDHFLPTPERRTNAESSGDEDLLALSAANREGSTEFSRSRLSSSPPVDASYGSGLMSCGATLGRSTAPYLTAATLDEIKSWSISTYKCTRQALQEKLGKSQRTVDVELESTIENLRQMQQRYQSVLRQARAMGSHFYHMQTSQKELVNEFQELAKLEPELQDEFTCNAKTQETLVANGEKLLAALNFFINSVNTLCSKTVEDTLLTIKNFESARLEYDAYKVDLEALQQGTSRGGDYQAKLHDAQNAVAEHKQRYEALRSDVQVKMRFLQDNKVKVMQKQLLLFHNSISAYFSGNQKDLAAALQQFHISPKTPNSQTRSWLEL